MGCWWGCVVAPFFSPFAWTFSFSQYLGTFGSIRVRWAPGFSFWRKVLISPPNYRKISWRILLVQKIPISPQTPPQNPFFCVYSFSGPGSANFLSLFFFFIPAWLPLQCMRFSPGTAAPLRRCIHLGHRLPWPCSHARTIFLFRGPRTLMYDASSAGLRIGSLAENGWQALRSFKEEKKPCWSGPGHGLGGPRRAHVHKIQVITWPEYVSRCRGRVYESLRNCKLTTKVLQKLFNIHKTSCRNVRGEPLCMSWQSSRFGLTNAGVGPPAEFPPIQWRVENYFYSFSTPQTPLVRGGLTSCTAGEASLNQIVENTQKPVRTPVGILSGSVDAAEREWSRKFSQDSW